MLKFHSYYLAIHKSVALIPPSVLSFLGIILFFSLGSAYSQNLTTTKAQKNVTELVRQGHLKLRQNQPEQALLDAQKAISLNGLSADAYFLLGSAEQDIGLKNDALRDYGKAISLNKNFVKAYSNRGLVKGSLGDLKGALIDFNQALIIDPAFATAYLNRGVVNGAIGNSRAALDDFNKAIKLNKYYADAYRNRGITKEFLGDIGGACSDWKMALSLGIADTKQWIISQCNN